MSGPLIDLAGLFASLSLLAVGGINAIVGEMQRQAVQVHRWMAPADFAELYALAQAAPGPNFLVATLVGLRVAGLAGAALATLALIGPTCVLTYSVSVVSNRFRTAPWRQALQAGLAPVTVGLVLATAALLASASATSGPRGALLLGAAGAMLFGRLHPVILLAAGAALGGAGLV